MHLYLRLAACVIAVMVPISAACAQGSAANYPSKPVSVVIPNPPGGSNGNEARIYTDKLQASLGQPFVFDYRAGAAGSIAVTYLLKALPDGHVIMMTSSGITVLPNFYPATNHAVVSTLTPVIELSNRGTGVIISPAALPTVYSLQDLVGYAKANSGKLNCGTSGSGGITHIVCASVANTLNIPITPVHYKGGGQSEIDLIAGRTQMHTFPLLVVLDQIRAGKLRSIATLGHERSRLLPDVSTSYEQGFNVDYPSWIGVFAPPMTPAAIVDKLNGALVKISKLPDVAKAMEAQGLTPVFNTPDAFQKKVTNELARWKKIVEDNNIRSTE